MRKPNGYGSIKRLSGSRRRPFVFVVSENGRQRPVEYFEEQIQAEIYQADFNRIHKHSSLPGHKITFRELYNRWFPQHIEENQSSQSTIYSYKNSYNHCSTIYDMELSDIKFIHLQGIIDNMKRAGLSYASCKKVRSLITLCYKYAIINDWVNKNYAELLRIGKNKPVRPHIPFSRQKINRLWDNVDYPGVDTVLMMLYMGTRIGELIHRPKEDVHLRQRYIYISKSKTKAGLRAIPIHDRIYPLVVARMNAIGPNLINDQDGRPYNYSRYITVWNNVMELINGTKHTTHDCRHTVTTLLDNAGANEVAKHRVLGHVAGDDVTDRVYTHKNLRQLRKCIMLLK